MTAAEREYSGKVEQNVKFYNNILLNTLDMINTKF